MTQTNQILDFAARLGREMLVSGANLERVNDSICRVCESYDLREVSVFCSIITSAWALYRPAAKRAAAR